MNHSLRQPRGIHRNFRRLAILVPLVVWTQLPPPSVAQATGAIQAKPEQKYRAAITITDVEETQPPISIRDRQFTVVVYKKRLVWPAAAQHQFSPDDDETAVSFDVKDLSGAVVFHLSVQDDPRAIQLDEIRREGRFLFTTSVDAHRLIGAKGEALLVDWGDLPSAPDACSTAIILGLFDGKLRPFSDTFCEDIIEPPGAEVHTWKLKTDQETGFDILEIRRRTGYYNVRIPIRVEFVMAKLLPARWCLQLNAAADMRERCEFPVEAERNPGNEDTFVRLFPEANEQMIPLHVVVKPSSKVEFLSAMAHNAMDRNGKWIPAPDTMETPWLKVHIDGKVGWVHTGEDLQALGLFLAG